MTTNGAEHETMIERVAKAIWEANAPPGAPEWEGLQGSDQYMVEIIAIECIRSMKGLSPGMGPQDDPKAKENCSITWNHLIDDALNEV